MLALKPTFGALNRHGGFDPSPSLNHLVLLGGNLVDIWDAAVHVAADVGGDPGCEPFGGGPALPNAFRPLGWPVSGRSAGG